MTERRTAPPEDAAGPRRWVVRIGAVTLVWLAWWGVALLGHGQVQPVLLGGSLLAAATILWAAGDMAAFSTATDWTPHYVPASPPAAKDPRFSRLSRLLNEAGDRVVVGDELRRTLRGLADERLAREHDIDRLQQPAEARVLLGAELDDYLRSDRKRRRLNESSHLSRMLSRIEAL